jgi:hypothetical protein
MSLNVALEGKFSVYANLTNNAHSTFNSILIVKLHAKLDEVTRAGVEADVVPETLAFFRCYFRP